MHVAGAVGQSKPAAGHVAKRAPVAVARIGARVSAKFRQIVARFRLYPHRSLQGNTRFAAFFKIYQIRSDYLADIFEIRQNFADYIANFATFNEISIR